ncbi:phospholipase A2, minor isoenzyme-like [Dendropsophus ebraccatus]|uniref:phospholipase A2, minor isoenzyme-like n=1 Tax=Dendropsophus ebraccatus TaxID=150705 RepID=UPI0038319CD7
MMLRFLAVLLAVSCACASPPSRALWNFHSLIKCAIPNSSPLKEFNNYGCYCGLGGKGTPIDTLDRCCQVHDNCYSQAKTHPSCYTSIDPYARGYDYTCSGTSITCTSYSDACSQFICNCDRTAAMCFAKSPYNSAYKNLDKNKYC